MPHLTIAHSAVTDDDNHHLHYMTLSVTPEMHEQAAPFVNYLNGADRHDPFASQALDRQAENFTRNLIGRGALRKKEVILNFNDEATMALHRHGAPLDAHDRPIPVRESHFKNGAPDFTIDYDSLGGVKHVAFKEDTRLFRMNMSPQASIAELHDIVAPTGAKTMTMDHAARPAPVGQIFAAAV